MDDRHYKPTLITAQRPWVSETRCHYTSPGQDVRHGDQGREGANNVSERVGRSLSPGSRMHAAAYFRGNKDRRNVLTDMIFSICGVAV